MTDVLVTLLSVPAPEAGESVHVTPLFEESFCTVALRTCVAPATTVAELGATETDTGGGGTEVPLSAPPHADS